MKRKVKRMKKRGKDKERKILRRERKVRFQEMFG